MDKSSKQVMISPEAVKGEETEERTSPDGEEAPPPAEEPGEGVGGGEEDQSAKSDDTISDIGEETGETKTTKSFSRQTQYSFMEQRMLHRIIVDEVDMTPDNIVDLEFVTMMDTFTHAAFETRVQYKSEMVLKQLSDTSRGDMGMRVFATYIDLDDIRIDHSINTEEGIEPPGMDADQAPSAYYLPKVYPPTKYPPEILVTLKETETLYLFDMPSFSCDRTNATESAKYDAENEFYNYITVGKGRNRKMMNKETQTMVPMSQTRHSLNVRPRKKNQASFASMWDMYDTYAKLAEQEEESEEDDMVMFQACPAHFLRKRKKKKKEELTPAEQFKAMTKQHNFQDAVMLTERVLASKEFGQQQKIYRGLYSMDPLSLDLIYIYTMQPLWTLQCEESYDRPITCINFNVANGNVLAVAHGKFGFADCYDGVVCIWSTKNPLRPERVYRFPCPVSALSFSNKNPNWLAIGFDNGEVMIIDITSYDIKSISKTARDTNPCFEPIWSTRWRYTENQESEFVMCCCEDGRINKYVSTKTHDLICTPMMWLSAVEGKMKGMETNKPCLKVEVPIVRHPAALCMIWHPTVDHIYYVGTDEGCIHKCSTHYLNQHMDVFKAHDGPIYDVSFSPFMKTLMVTCGADCAIRMWIEGIDEVILTLLCPSAVYGVAFCPISATILVSVSGTFLYVWDLRRKTHVHCAEYVSADNTGVTYCSFTASGDNVFMGDKKGRITTFHLIDTPIPPYYQYKILDDTLKQALCTRPQLLKKVKKLESFLQRRS